MPANTCMHAQCPPPSHERASVSMRDVHFPHVSERLEAHKEGKLGGHISAGAPVAAVPSSVYVLCTRLYLVLQLTSWSCNTCLHLVHLHLSSSSS
eukprot:scaffold131734_cov19-Tisochrysis_lutea.AAC.2